VNASLLHLENLDIPFHLGAFFKRFVDSTAAVRWRTDSPMSLT
jgi:hypothetical protein